MPEAVRAVHQIEFNYFFYRCACAIHRREAVRPLVGVREVPEQELASAAQALSCSFVAAEHEVDDDRELDHDDADAGCVYFCDSRRISCAAADRRRALCLIRSCWLRRPTAALAQPSVAAFACSCLADPSGDSDSTFSLRHLYCDYNTGTSMNIDILQTLMKGKGRPIGVLLLVMFRPSTSAIKSEVKK